MEFDKLLEGIIARDLVHYALHQLHELSVAAGSAWDFGRPSTMEIVVNDRNAYSIYGWCRDIRSTKNAPVTRAQMRKIKEARQKAHEYLYAEANDPSTSIERKIELVRLTSKAPS